MQPSTSQQVVWHVLSVISRSFPYLWKQKTDSKTSHLFSGIIHKKLGPARHNKNKTGVTNDPLGQSTDPAGSDRHIILKFWDGRTDGQKDGRKDKRTICVKIVITTVWVCMWSATWIKKLAICVGKPNKARQKQRNKFSGQRSKTSLFYLYFFFFLVSGSFSFLDPSFFSIRKSLLYILYTEMKNHVITRPIVALWGFQKLITLLRITI